MQLLDLRAEIIIYIIKDVFCVYFYTHAYYDGGARSCLHLKK